MGKTPKPLHILVHESLMDAPEIRALAEKGHSVVVNPVVEVFDLMLGPNAWRMTPELLPYLEVAIKAARAGKYGKEKGE